MLITRKSPFTQQINSLELNVTQEQMNKFVKNDGFIQDIFPKLTPSEREFLLTGYTQEDWDNMFEAMVDENWDNEP